MSVKVPPPAFARFERVLVNEKGNRFGEHGGEQGAIVWLDSYHIRREPTRPDRWTYIVYLPVHRCWRTFFQSDLESVGVFDHAADHLGQRAELSFDVILNEDNNWAEGSFRLPGEFWKVMIFRKDDVLHVQHKATRWKKPTEWEQEIPGIVFQIPATARANRDYLVSAISDAVGFTEWIEVIGPDSIVLR